MKFKPTLCNQPIDLSNIDTKRLLVIYRKTRARQSACICSCCGEIYGDENNKLYVDLGDEMKVLKAELDKRPNIEPCTKRQKRNLGKNRKSK